MAELVDSPLIRYYLRALFLYVEYTAAMWMNQASVERYIFRPQDLFLTCILMIMQYVCICAIVV